MSLPVLLTSFPACPSTLLHLRENKGGRDLRGGGGGNWEGSGERVETTLVIWNGKLFEAQGGGRARPPFIPRGDKCLLSSSDSSALLPAASNLWLQGHQVFLRPIVHGCGESMQRGISSELQLVQERRPLYICQPHMPGEVAMLSCNNSAPCHQAANGFWFRFNFQQTAMPTPHPSAGADSAAELTALVNGCLTAYHTSL